MKIRVLGVCLAVAALVGFLVALPMHRVSATGTQQIEAAGNANTCSTSPTSLSTCTLSVTWPQPFADTNYKVVCQPQNGVTSAQAPGAPSILYMYPPARTTTGASMTIETLTPPQNFYYNPGAASLNGIDCIAVHN